ncbi:hypothetical protein [Isoptericola sp. NPDC056134]|uniref:hypothetical protein n=1 Tax=Isoptericola sp. NPDC056134 TaxID=3345723 RepID=UPI0035E84052
MTTTIRLKLNHKNIRALLRSEPIRADIERRARAVAAAAGGEEKGFEVDVRVGSNRVRASVRTATREAREAEATDRTLTRALDAGRR